MTTFSDSLNIGGVNIPDQVMGQIIESGPQYSVIEYFMIRFIYDFFLMFNKNSLRS